MNNNYNKKYKKPKKKTLATTNPDTSTSKFIRHNSETNPTEHPCSLLAKDSEWVDLIKTTEASSSSDAAPGRERGASDEEEVLQLVDCEDGPQMKPLAIMFPGLLDKDPQTLDGIFNRAMSTTEVTRQLVGLGQKANFTFMKKADRLIPPDKIWLDSVTENSNSVGSLNSGSRLNPSVSSYQHSDSDRQPQSVNKINLSQRNKAFPILKLNESFSQDSEIDDDTE